MPDLVSSLQNLAIIVCFGAGGILSLLYWYQRNLIYPANFPADSRTTLFTPSQFGLNRWHDVHLVAEDGVKIRAYMIWGVGNSADTLSKPSADLAFSSSQLRQRPTGQLNSETGVTDATGATDLSNATEAPAGQFSDLTVIIFHANAGNHGHRLPLATLLHRHLQPAPNVFLLSYRGYGPSEGSPTEEGIRMDARAAVNWVKGNPWLGKGKGGKGKVVVWGQSIGGAVAIDTAASHPDVVDAVIVENTFESLPSLIPHVLPILSPLRPLIRHLVLDHWSSATTLATVAPTVPILFLSGARDELVPQGQMEVLWRVGAMRGLRGVDLGEKSEREIPVQVWREFENGTHNDTVMQEGYFRELAAFIHRHVLPPSPAITVSAPPYHRMAGLNREGVVVKWSDGDRMNGEIGINGGAGKLKM
ncbi:hypothetical protein HDU93_008728 [Gonapodya sp. JEL0774]|nr:hypothetical protein HDU93_008728 [Gonapodya sp. JEL0774]